MSSLKQLQKELSDVGDFLVALGDESVKRLSSLC